MKQYLVLSLAVTAIVVLVSRCGSATSDSLTNALSKAMGAIAVTSPAATSSSSSASASLFGMKKSFTAFMQFTGLNVVLTMMGVSEAADETGAPTTVKPVGEMTTEMKNATTADPATTAAALGNPIEKKSFKALCYGPSWTDNATGSNVNRPSGDLGIVYATASNTDTRACAAAQVDALMAGAPMFFNNFIKMQAVMLAAANKAGKSLPDEGKTEDLTTVMPTLTGITLTNADLIRVDTTDNSEMYKSVFDFTSNSKTASVTIYHAPANADNTNFSGLAKATVPHSGSNNASGDQRHMSMVYSQTDGVLKISVKIMAERTNQSGSAFTSGNEVDLSKFTGNDAWEDGHWILAELNTTTGAGVLHYAWQAGSNDGATRSFAFNVAADGTGTAYAGFGVAMSILTAAAAPWTTNMRCNWLDGISNSASTPKVQKQVLSKDAKTGKWLASSSNINFAPTNSCAKSGTWAVSGATGASFLDGTKTTTSHELVEPPTASNVAAITAPTFTVPTGN